MKIKKPGTNAVFSVILFFILMTYAAPAISQEASGQAGQQQCFMWAVDAGPAKIYLLGSIHILKPDFYPLPNEIDTAYRKSKQIVFETDMDALSTPSAQQKILALGLYQGEDTLMQHLSAPIQKQLQKKLSQLSLPLAHLNKFRPWFCALTLTVIEFQRLGFRPELGIDQHFFQKAKTDGKKRVFLETADFQINLMSGLTALDQEHMLSQTLKDLEIIGKYASDMETAWKTGNGRELQAILTQSFESFPKIYDKFIINRNKDWLPKIINMIHQKQDTLIIVGAGHLVGPESVIMMLKNKGYNIRQVSSAAN